jgi:hypothetical protein
MNTGLDGRHGLKSWKGLCALWAAVLLAGCNFTASATPPKEATPSPQVRTAAPTWTPISPQPPMRTVVISPLPPTASVIPTLANVATPRPGWTLYANAFLGYQFSYPSGASVEAHGFVGMPADQKLPEGFTEDEYFHYAEEVLPPELCVSVSNGAGSLTIMPPYQSVGRFTGPCPGLGIGTGYRIVAAKEDVWIAGAQYAMGGKKLYRESSGEFDFEYYLATLNNGFRVALTGRLPNGMSAEEYAVRRQELFEILMTLGWTAVPDLTLPGFTCAGKFTHLMPGVQAVVTTGEARNLYAQADAGSPAAGRLEPGEVVWVVKGPVCASEQVLWLVQGSKGGVGWTAEGDFEANFLERYRP